jgi:class 3 adenylate cyclase
VVGPTTRDDLGDRATVIPLGETQLKGKRDPVTPYRLASVTG